MDTDTKPAHGAQVTKDERATNESNKSGENEMAQASQPSGKGVARNPASQVRGALEEAVKGIPNPVTDQVPDDVKKDLDALLDRLIPNGAKPPKEDDPCRSLNTKQGVKIAVFCHTRKRALDTAENSHDAAKRGASVALQAALDAWKDAKSEYDFEMANAKSQLHISVQAAIEAYDDKKNDDSRSRSRYLSYTLEEAVAVAIQMFEASGASAASALAGAAGTLLGAYATYVSAIRAAQSQLLADNASAYQVFWQSAENVWDAT